jgi:hypothetical protein
LNSLLFKAPLRINKASNFLVSSIPNVTSENFQIYTVNFEDFEAHLALNDLYYGD